MADVALITLQVGGKVRRFLQANLEKKETAEQLARRQGDCNRCGACCKILFRCPFLGEEEDGRYFCKVYDQRPSQCRLFPISQRDLRELNGQCSYTFVPVPALARAASFE